MAEKMPLIYMAEKSLRITTGLERLSDPSSDDPAGFCRTDSLEVDEIRRAAQSIVDEIDLWRAEPDPGPSSVVVKVSDDYSKIEGVEFR